MEEIFWIWNILNTLGVVYLGYYYFTINKRMTREIIEQTERHHKENLSYIKEKDKIPLPRLSIGLWNRIDQSTKLQKSVFAIENSSETVALNIQIIECKIKDKKQEDDRYIHFIEQIQKQLSGRDVIKGSSISLSDGKVQGRKIDTCTINFSDPEGNNYTEEYNVPRAYIDDYQNI